MFKVWPVSEYGYQNDSRLRLAIGLLAIKVAYFNARRRTWMATRFQTPLGMEQYKNLRL